MTALRIPLAPEPAVPAAGPVVLSADVRGGAGGAAIPVGISACLLGAPVRHDGGHKRDHYCTGELARWFRFRSFCPEQALGLGTPREAIHLRRRDDGAVRLVGVSSGADHTGAMQALAAHTLPELADLCGYVVAKKSPSCGLERVRVYHGNGMPDSNDARGLFTDALLQAYPLLPVEEEGRLNDPPLRENFVSRVFVLARWRALRAEGVTAARLIAFHSAHKYLLMAHSIVAYRELGRLLADLSGRDLDAVADRYIAALMPALARPVTRKGHANVLLHISGYFRRHLPAAHRQRLRTVIDNYRLNLVPLSAPLTLIQHFLADHPDPYLAAQVYLQPHPDALRLRAFQ